jgi:hypothetical protein
MTSLRYVQLLTSSRRYMAHEGDYDAECSGRDDQPNVDDQPPPHGTGLENVVTRLRALQNVASGYRYDVHAVPKLVTSLRYVQLLTSSRRYMAHEYD